MAKQLQLRRGTTAQHATFTGALGEVTMDTDKKVVVVHDGATAGGFPSQKQLVSGTNIKTINNTSLLGSGDISIIQSTTSVANIDEMKDFVAPYDNYALNVLGYSEAGDGGGGTFYWDATSTEDDNGGTIIEPTSGNGRWIRQYSGPVNVKWFGAKGDNTFDNTLSIQNTIDYATTNKTGVFVPSGIYNINGILKITCSFIGQDKNTTKLKFKNNGVKEFSLTIEESNIEVSNLSIDNGCSNDPNDWTNNYDNFTGRYGARIIGNREVLKISNLNISNTVMAGIAVYGVAKNSLFENIYTSRNRGNFGDGFYFSSIDSCTVINCSAYDFTRIGFVTDDALNEYTPRNNVFNNCKAEYGHNHSYLHGGGEFNSGIWCENSTNIVIENCYLKNTGGRGISLTTGNFSSDMVQKEAFYQVSNTTCEGTGTAFVCDSLGLINNNINISNCTAILNAGGDITCNTYGDNLTLNVNVSNFTSEKKFAGLSQSRVFSFNNSSANSTINLTANNIFVTSDFNPSTFTYSNLTGHFGTFSNAGTVNIDVTNMEDKNGVLLNSQSGARLGRHTFRNIDNLHIYSVMAEYFKVDNCIVNTFSGYSPFGIINTTINNSTINSTVNLVSNSVDVSNCIINVPSDGHFYHNSYFSSSASLSRVMFKMVDCIINKDYTGTIPYAVSFATKNAPNKASLLIDNCIFNNTAATGSGAYPLYTSNGFSNFLGTSFMDGTIQYYLKNYSTLETSSSVFIKKTFQ